MKKTIHKIISVIAMFAMLLSTLPTLTYAVEATPKIVVADATAATGDTVDITVSLENNPGLISMTLRVNYDPEHLQLTSVTDSGLLPGKTHKPELDSPYTLAWANDTAAENYTVEGVIVTLSFKILDTAVINEKYAVNVSYDLDNWDIYNYMGDVVDFGIENGGITVSCPHTNKTEVPSKSASCTASGNNLYYTCDSCGMAFKADGITQTTVDDETIPTTGHSYNEADCTTPKTCTTCGATDGNALGHSFTNYISNSDATCTQDGTKTAKCDRCTATDTVADVGSANGHDYNDATCTAPNTCKVCNATEGTSLGHSYTNYTSNNDATCTQDGTKTAKCDRCTETDTIADADSAKGHDYAAATCTLPKTCKVCNVTEGSALGHSYSTAWSKGEEGHWHECATCEDKIDLVEHDFGADGDKCTICEYERSHVHRLTLVPGTDATCTDDGSKAYYTCSGCEDWFEDALGTVLIADKSAVVVPTQGHEFAAATCTTVKTCKSCGATEGALLDHSDTNSDGKCDMCRKTMIPTAQPDPSSPATGDTSNVFLWIAVMLLSMGAIAVCLVGSKKRIFR